VTDVPACEKLLERLVSGGTVNVKEMRDALADDLWQSYQMQLQNSRVEREMADTGKLIFAEYNRKLNVANMLYGRCEHMSAKASRKAAKFSNKIDGLYEAAIETLQETLASDISAQAYIEAGYSDDPEQNTISLCPDGMPRMVFRKGNIATRDQCKVRILTEAIAETDTRYGIGANDLRSGTALNTETLSARLINQRIENTQAASLSKSDDKRFPAFKKFFGN